MAGGPVLGVVVGGPIVEAFGWRLIFVVQVPLTLLALVVAFVPCCRDTERAGSAHAVRPRRARSVFAVGVGAVSLLALNRGPGRWVDRARSWWSGFVRARSFLVVLRARRAAGARPADPARSTSGGATSPSRSPSQFFTNFAYMGGFILTPLLLQNVLGYGETQAGLLSIARPLVFAIAGPLAGYLTIRVGERAVGVVRRARRSSLSMLALARSSSVTADLVIIGGAGALRASAWARRRRRWRPPSPTPSTTATSASPAPPSRW